MPAIFSMTRGLRLVGGTVLLAAVAVMAHAQNTQVHDPALLKQQLGGARVAIVEFADMECPQCGHANPILKQAVAQYHIPWIRRDFPLQQHIWSRQAALNARWFETAKSKALGDEYRDAVFASQNSIFSLVALNEFTQKFAHNHGITLPFAIDPLGKLDAAIKADSDLGQRLGIDHTPTVWVLASKGAPYTEVSTDMHDLYQIIDQALASTKEVGAAPKKPVKK